MRVRVRVRVRVRLRLRLRGEAEGEGAGEVDLVRTSHTLRREVEVLRRRHVPREQPAGGRRHHGVGAGLAAPTQPALRGVHTWLGLGLELGLGCLW